MKQSRRFVILIPTVIGAIYVGSYWIVVTSQWDSQSAIYTRDSANNRIRHSGPRFNIGSAFGRIAVSFYSPLAWTTYKCFKMPTWIDDYNPAAAEHEMT